ncbi:putative tail fiber assembly protein homolog (plasmid) [Ralstonia solanacearum CMR15]|nr:putative tail fiber assembly protein homolog [Ralstonia solanacearum CMR15]
MLIHQYDHATAQYIASHLADPDPLNDGRWLIPAFATATPLPERPARTWPFFLDGAWVLRPDHRGQRLYRTDTGEAAEIVAAGIAPEAAGLTPTPRPSDEHRWIDGAWQIDPQIVAQRARDAAMREFDLRMASARQANAGRADAYAAGLLSDAEIAVFKAWAIYQMDLVRVVSAASFPDDVQWPAEPDEAAVIEQADGKASAGDAAAA